VRSRVVPATIFLEPTTRPGVQGYVQRRLLKWVSIAAAACLTLTVAVWAASYLTLTWRSPGGGSVVAFTRGSLVWHRAVPPGMLNPPKGAAAQLGRSLFIGGDPHCRATWLPWLTRHTNRRDVLVRTEAALPLWTVAAVCALCLAWTRRRAVRPRGGRS
jgi:hypothetical protein